MDTFKSKTWNKNFHHRRVTAWAKTTTTNPDSLHIIMVRTSNIKRGEMANQCITKYEELTHTLERINIQYRIMQTPLQKLFWPRYELLQPRNHQDEPKTSTTTPDNKHGSNRNRQKPHSPWRNTPYWRSLCDNKQHHHPRIHNSPSVKDRDIENEDESLRITVQGMNNEAPSPPRQSTNREETVEITTEIITTNKQLATIVIGRKGATIISIKETTGVEINRIKCSEETSFIVNGSTKSVRQARQLMESIIKGSTLTQHPKKNATRYADIMPQDTAYSETDVYSSTSQDPSTYQTTPLDRTSQNTHHNKRPNKQTEWIEKKTEHESHPGKKTSNIHTSTAKPKGNIPGEETMKRTVAHSTAHPHTVEMKAPYPTEEAQKDT